MTYGKRALSCVCKVHVSCTVITSVTNTSNDRLLAWVHQGQVLTPDATREQLKEAGEAHMEL